ncbi:metalloregulator ArsR/SmtB family transcription factor [Peptostreptococcaceae bacterium AGR-M142]
MDNYKNNPTCFEENADLLKALSHPVRLCIVKGLIENGESNVSNMQNCLDMPQSTISQHISKLKACKVIKGYRNGLEIKYKVENEKIIEIIKILF